jgi:GTPase
MNITKCGFVAIIGKPNAGKSTLLNSIIEKKVSIITHKSQTTRNKIQAIKNTEKAQIIFSDTPGLENMKKSNLNRQLNRTAQQAAIDADVIVFITTTSKWDENDEWALDLIQNNSQPVILVINKIDQLKNQDNILPIIAKLNEHYSFTETVTISALKNQGVNRVVDILEQQLPEAKPLFDDIDAKTNHNLHICELIREQLLKNLHQEVPYELTVQVEQIVEEENLNKIHALIWVASESQKKIVIGNKGESMKNVGTQARKQLEKHFDKKVFLKLWVKVKPNWWDDPNFINNSKV